MIISLNKILPNNPLMKFKRLIRYTLVHFKTHFHFRKLQESHIFNTKSVYPFISHLDALVSDEFVVGHRFFDSSESLLSYINYPDGLILQYPETYTPCVFMFESHANTLGMTLPLNDVSKTVLIDNCRGFHQSPNILMFWGGGFFHGKEGKEFGNTQRG